MGKEKRSSLSDMVAGVLTSLITGVVKSSIDDTVKKVEKRLLKWCIGATAVTIGAVMVMIGVVNVVALFMPLWQAFLIFGVILAVIGALLVKF